MKNVFLFLVLFCAFANAANYVVLESSTAGTEGVDPAQNSLEAPAADYAEAPAADYAEAPAADYNVPDMTNVPNFVDSAAYYETLANQTANELSVKSNGSGFITAGIISLIVGVSSMIFIAADEDDFCEEVYRDDYSYECELNGAGALLMMTGLGVTGMGAAFLPIGIVKKAKYKRMVRKEQMYRNKSRDFRAMSLSQLYIKPVINVHSKSLGAKIALNF